MSSGITKRLVRHGCLKSEPGYTVQGADRFSIWVSFWGRGRRGKAMDEQARGQAWQDGVQTGWKTGLEKQKFGPRAVWTATDL